MKGYFCDFLMPEGHKGFNKKLIKIISDSASLKVLLNQEYLEKSDLEYSKLTFIDIKKRIRLGKIKSRIDSLQLILKIKKHINLENNDFLIVSSFDTLTMLIGQIFLKNKEKIYLIHHNNVDIICKNKFQNLCFKIYMNKFKHIVLEEFIKRELVDKTGIKKESVFVLPHPINYDNKKVFQTKYEIFALSNSNDQKIVEKISGSEKFINELQKFNQKMIIKSKNDNEINNENLRIVQGFISSNDYNKYLLGSKKVFLPFSKKYNNRTSGVLLEALANGKKVIGTNIKIFREYASKYPSMIEIMDDDINSIINSNIEIVDIDYNNFIEDHCDNKINEVFVKIINRNNREFKNAK